MNRLCVQQREGGMEIEERHTEGEGERGGLV